MLRVARLKQQVPIVPMLAYQIFPPDLPISILAKVVSGSPVDILQTMQFTLSVDLTQEASGDLINPAIEDILPPLPNLPKLGLRDIQQYSGCRSSESLSGSRYHIQCSEYTLNVLLGR